MIVCQCNAISDSKIESSVAELLAAQPDANLTAGAVVKHLGVRRKCTGCLNNLNRVITDCSQRCGCAVCPRTGEPLANQITEQEYEARTA